MIPLAILAGAPSFAGDSATDAKSAKEKIEKTDSESRDVLNELYMIQKRVREISRSRERLNEMMLSSDSDAQILAQSVSSLEKRLQAQRRRLLAPDVFGLSMEQSDLLPFLFSSASANEFDRNLIFMRLLSERDFNYVKKYQSTLKMTHSQRTRLNAKVRSLISLKKKIDSEESGMANAFEQKNRLLAHLRSEQRPG